MVVGHARVRKQQGYWPTHCLRLACASRQCYAVEVQATPPPEMRRIETDRSRAIGVRVTELRRLHVLIVLNLVLGVVNLFL